MHTGPFNTEKNIELREHVLWEETHQRSIIHLLQYEVEDGEEDLVCIVLLVDCKTMATNYDWLELQQDEHQGGHQSHVGHGFGPNSEGSRDGELAEGSRYSWSRGPSSAAGGHYSHCPARRLYPTWSNPVTFRIYLFFNIGYLTGNLEWVHINALTCPVLVAAPRSQRRSAAAC